MAPSPMNPTAMRSLAPRTLPVNSEVVKTAAAPLRRSLRGMFILLLLVTKLASICKPVASACRLCVAADLKDPRHRIAVGGLHFDTHRLHFRRFETVAVEPLEIILHRRDALLPAIGQARNHHVILHRLWFRRAPPIDVLRFLRAKRELA